VCWGCAVESGLGCCCLAREVPPGGSENSSKLEVQEGVQGVLAMATAEAAPLRWKHKVEPWKHPKACHQTTWAAVSCHTLSTLLFSWLMCRQVFCRRALQTTTTSSINVPQ
jgi:hypothetical protein